VTLVRVLIALPIGLAVGSFMTVAIHRIPAGESLSRPRSRCPACGTQIRARDNVPVVSWLLLRGRCRACGAGISAVYPLTELATAALVVGAVVAFDPLWQAALVAALLALMPGIAVIDIRHRIIPNRLVYPSLLGFAAAIAVGDLLSDDVNAPGAVLGFLAYGGGLLVIALIAPAGMGMGDVKLAALVGLVLGSLGLRYVAVAAGLGILLGGLAAIVALAAGAGRRGTLPYGPFLAAGAALAAFVGSAIADRYLDLFA
jgi:leader peptidase (prepilin peptidase)/N-methyltransferase